LIADLARGHDASSPGSAAGFVIAGRTEQSPELGAFRSQRERRLAWGATQHPRDLGQHAGGFERRFGPRRLQPDSSARSPTPRRTVARSASLRRVWASSGWKPTPRAGFARPHCQRELDLGRAVRQAAEFGTRGNARTTCTVPASATRSSPPAAAALSTSRSSAPTLADCGRAARPPNVGHQSTRRAPRRPGHTAPCWSPLGHTVSRASRSAGQPEFGRRFGASESTNMGVSARRIRRPARCELFAPPAGDLELVTRSRRLRSVDQTVETKHLAWSPSRVPHAPSTVVGPRRFGLAADPDDRRKPLQLLGSFAKGTPANTTMAPMTRSASFVRTRGVQNESGQPAISLPMHGYHRRRRPRHLKIGIPARRRLRPAADVLPPGRLQWKWPNLGPTATLHLIPRTDPAANSAAGLRPPPKRDERCALRPEYRSIALVRRAVSGPGRGGPAGGQSRPDVDAMSDALLGSLISHLRRGAEPRGLRRAVGGAHQRPPAVPCGASTG